MTEQTSERWSYLEEDDILDVYFDGFGGERPVWTIELTDNITITIDRSSKKALALGLLDVTALASRTPSGPRSFPITGLADLPLDERDLVLEALTSDPVRRWLDVSTVELLPDSPFAVIHLAALPSELSRRLAVPA
ncbi:MAG: hypothetical protein KDD11_23010 [Acidobacteria bacterium]|nr:hypothetical protein [Acidobacteriota bacterium]